MFPERGDADHGNLLHVGAVVARGLQTVQGELCGNVFRGDVTAPLSGAAALKQVVRQKAHMSTDAFGVNLLKCRNGGGGESGPTWPGGFCASTLQIRRIRDSKTKLFRMLRGSEWAPENFVLYGILSS